MERRESTPARQARRKYEEKNKDKRKQVSGNFGTLIPRALFDEINVFSADAEPEDDMTLIILKKK